ncbi:MAG: response regulator [Clostridiales bacterium]|nr:response regulator [Clostridiales bacterium]
MSSFASTLKKLRYERNMSQQQLADLLFVDRSSIANWENGRRVPNAILLTNLANILGVDVSVLINDVADDSSDNPVVIVVDDESIILNGELAVLKKLLPGANIIGFTSPSEALEYTRSNQVNIAFLDIEIGSVNGIELCSEIMNTQQNVNVIFLTAYVEYSFDAWSTGACGFIVKPVSESSLRNQLSMLRFPVRGLKIND